MSLSPIQVQLLANTEPFRTAIQRAISLVMDAKPLIMRAHWAMQRRQVRQVTRAKQRRRW